MKKLKNLASAKNDTLDSKQIQQSPITPKEKKEEDFFRSTLNNLLEGCQIIGFDWRYIYLNNAAAVHFRRPKQELLGQKYIDIWPGIEKNEVFRLIRNCLNERTPHHLENEFVFPDGMIGWFDLSIQPVPEGVLILSMDITDRKRAEEMLHESEEKFRNVFDHSVVGNSLTTIDGKLKTNKAFCQILGYNEDELSHLKWQEITHPGDIKNDQKVINSIISGYKAQARWEKRYIHKNGNFIWVDISTALQRDMEGNPLYFITSIIDITEHKLAEKKLHESEERFRKIFEEGPLGVAMASLTTGKFINANKAFCNMLGFTEKELIELTFRDVTYHDDRSDDVEAVRSLREDQIQKHTTEKRYQTKKGEVIWAHRSMTKIYNETDQSFYALAMIKDITERKLAEKELGESQEMFSKAFQAGPAGMTITRISDGKFISANESFCKMFEFDLNEVIGHTSTELNMWSTEERNRLIQKQLASGGLHNFELLAYSKSRRLINILFSSREIELRSETCHITTMIDITERNLAEEKLHESEDKFRTLMMASSDSVYRMSPDWKVMYELDGRGFIVDTAKPNDKWFQEYIPPDDQMHVMEVIQEAIRTKSLFELEHRVWRVDGSYGWTFSRAIPRLDANGEIFEWFGAASDVTAKVLAKEALRKSEHEFRTLAESMPQIVWATRADGWNIYFNQQWMNYTGMTLEESYGNGWNKPFHPDDRQRAWDAWQNAVINNGIYSIEARLRRFDGEYRWWLVRGVPLIDENGTLQKWFGTCTDIEEIKRTENELVESEETYRLLFESINDAILVAQLNDDQSFNYINVNDIACKLYGYTREEFLTKTPNDIISENGKKTLKNRVQKLLNNKFYSYETEHVKKDGQIFPVEISTQNTQIRNKTIFSAIVRDITERKKAEAEIKKLNAELEEKVKLRTAQLEASNKELEAFSYSVSHDLRSPLRHINGFAEILTKQYSDQLPEEARKYIITITGSAKKMGSLIDDLLSFSKTARAELKKSTLKMNQVIDDALAQIKPSLKDRKIEWKIVPLPEVHGDHNLLCLAWINLLDNAVKYTRTRENAVIQIGYNEDTRETVFYIKDNGVGFDMKYAQKLFGVFQRLHSTSEFDGTGIGLANVQRIILRHGGRTWAEAETDKGATFYISIPKLTDDKYETKNNIAR